MATENRTHTGRFKKGVSGNPGGRPSTPKEIKEAFAKLLPKSVAKIDEIISNSDDDKLVLDAIKVVLDRVLGKPNQAMEIDNNIGFKNPLEGLTTEELKKLIKK